MNSESDLGSLGAAMSTASAPAANPSIDRLLLRVGREELAGLQALARLDRASDGEPEKLERTARLLLRNGLEAKLSEVGLPWAPTPALVDEYVESPRVLTGRQSDEVRADSTEGPARVGDGLADPHTRSRLALIWGNDCFRVPMLVAIAVGTLVVLLGGYVGRWSWTGFESNDQVWDWLHLLLLPVAFGTVPLWLSFGEHMSRTRKLMFVAAILAFVGFVVAGYLVPLTWTGFSGNNLWDWLTLIVLPVAVITIGAWPSSSREIRSSHIALFSLLGVAWVVTLVGGYTAAWQWTGYPGNTLWDWLRLLLAPLVITTVLVPAAVRWISGDVARLAEQAERERTARATHRGPAPARPAPIRIDLKP